MKSITAIFAGLVLTIATDARGQAGADPSWLQIAPVVERLSASDSLTEVEQVLRANNAVVANARADALFASALQGTQLTSDQRMILTLARETFRDAREAGIEVAAEALGVRVTILELTAAQDEGAARAVLAKRRDVTSSPHLAAAFRRLAAQPDVNPTAMQEIAAAFREANQSPDSAIARLRRLAGAAAAPAAPSGGTAGAASGGAAALAGHWRCTTIVGGGDASITTDHHMVLGADGIFRSWQRSFSSFSGRETNTEPETGRWTVRGSTLVFTGANGQPVEVPFQRSGDTILLPNESTRRIWERVQ